MTPTSSDPLGRRALFAPVPSTSSAPPPEAAATRSSAPATEAAPAAAGRRAFFSEPPVPPSGRGATVRLICRSCRAATPLSPIGTLRRLLGSLWWPFGAWNHRLRCPHCGHVGWCRLEWDGLFDWR